MRYIYILFLFIVYFLNSAFPQILADRNALLSGTADEQKKVVEALGYPSPKSVLDLASSLKLTDGQRSSLNDIYNETVMRAKELGKQIVKIEEELFGALQAGLVSEKSVSDDAQQIGRLRGRLRGVFLVAHLKTKKLLSANQLDMFRKLTVPAGKK